MEDLFSIEQKIFEEALVYARELRKGEALDYDKADAFVKEYGKLLRQLRRATRIADRAMSDLNSGKVRTQGGN